MSTTPEHGEDHWATNRHLIEEWHRTGDMGALWPDVPAAERHSAQAQVRAVTEAVLRSSATRPALFAPDERQARTLGIAGYTSGMGPLLGWWIQQGLVEAPPQVREVFARHLDHGRRRRSVLSDALVRIVQAMRAEGVHPVVIKGLHTGAVYFPDAGTRPAADIDLLVRPAERGQAVEALGKAGFVESRRTRYAARSEWRPIDRPHGVHSLELDHVDNPWSVDLHTALERWYFRGLRRGLGEEPFDHMTEVPISGTTVRALAQPYVTAFLALHASHDLVQMQLVRLVELVLVIRADVRKRALDWAAFASLIRETGIERFVHPALALAEALAPGTVERALLERLGRLATPRTRRVLARVIEADMGALRYRSLDDKLMWASGPRELLLSVSELVAPSDDGMPVGLARLYWRRLLTFARGLSRSRGDGDAGERGL